MRRFWLPFMFWAIAIGCGLTYHLIGAHVDEQGVLHEPFGLIPLGWLFFLLGWVALGIVLFRSKRGEDKLR